MPPKEKGRVYRHTFEDRLQARVPRDVTEVWRGPLKGKMSRFLIEGARKYLEENGHSAISIEQELLARREKILREEVELQILEMKLAGMRGIHGPPPSAPTTPPPTNGRGNGNGALEKAEKEFRAYHRSQERAHVPREERRKNLLGKCQEILQRNKDLQASFRAADDLLTYFAKRIL